MKQLHFVFKLSLLCLLLPLFCGCNEEDDIEGIFYEKTWYVTALFQSDGKTSALDEAEQKKLRENQANYYLSFANGTFKAQLGNNSYSGKWVVDGKKNSIGFILDSNVQGNDVISKAIIKILREAERYDGTYSFLRIYTDADTSILFSPGK